MNWNKSEKKQVVKQVGKLVRSPIVIDSMVSRHYGIILLAVLLTISCDLSEDQRFRNWDSYQGDKGRTGYSSLDQINRDNVSQLEVAWIFRTGDLGKTEANPIIIDGKMYIISANMKVFALNAATGEEIWSFDPFKGVKRRGLSRGVSYWEDGGDKRVLFSAGSYIYALNAENGEIIKSFGNQGKVSLNKGLGRDENEISVRSTSPGAVYKDILIQGSSVGEGYGTPPGYVRAYNIRTGELEWIFHTIPQPGEPGYETWEKDSWKHIGGANVWTGMTVDQERGIVYLPVASPNVDYYGGRRKGKNLYSNSLVALDAATGKRIWHYQTVHHGLWDFDLPAPPNLVTVDHNGEEVDAISQITKTGFVFLFNRETGESLFPIEEKKVPQSRIKGEEVWPTQPFPQAPEPFIRQRFTKEDITNISPEAHKAVLEKFKTLRNEGLFTPPDTAGTILLPGSRGGGNWGGPAYDPGTDILYISAKESPEIATMKMPDTLETNNTTLFDLGKSFYTKNCASCHGIDRKGSPPVFPSLVNIGSKRTEEVVLNTIKYGVGRMPSFQHISKQEGEAIISYLFNKESAKNTTVNIDNPQQDGNSTPGPINITGRGYFRGPDGYPAITPPWGTLNALDLNTGEYLWKIPLGEHEELTEKGIPQTGTENWGGPIVTGGGLVFIAATIDKKFRAFDKSTGELLWETTLPTAGIAKPATFEIEGKQYVVIAVGGGRGTEPGDYFIAFSLPD